jgi:2-polyprenyl-3-methyl-5-hydroxy-6-metoxy-1,4-benzoquinol methylase
MSEPVDRYERGKLSGFLETVRLRQASRYINSGNRVLDLACNEGRLIDYLPQDCDYLGIDIAEKAINIARSRHPDYEFIVADLSDSIPTLTHQFDIVVMLAFLEHIADPGSMLKTVIPALKTGGKIIATTPAPYGRRVHDMGAIIGVFSKEAAEEHESFLGKSDLIRIAGECGLSVMTFERFLFGFNQLIVMQK